MAPDVSNLPMAYLTAGQVRIARSPLVMQTVLGSCVAAVFWSPAARVGAMCHGALPCCPTNLMGHTAEDDRLRYVDFAIRYMAEQLLSMGVTREGIEVKLFGGAEVLPMRPRSSSALSVGSQNTFSAVRALKEEGLRLTVSDLGGTQGRVVYFRTDTGAIWLRRLPASQLPDNDTRLPIALR